MARENRTNKQTNNSKKKSRRKKQTTYKTPDVLLAILVPIILCLYPFMTNESLILEHLPISQMCIINMHREMRGVL